ncbi:MAG: hypothetical protein J2P26_11525 [Nocardiopsaceae bacterium]|nr:hypothetical protein [Nocardiopsaceae bacterium]
MTAVFAADAGSGGWGLPDAAPMMIKIRSPSDTAVTDATLRPVVVGLVHANR